MEEKKWKQKKWKKKKYEVEEEKKPTDDDILS